MTALLTAEFRKVLGLRYWWILGIAPAVVGLFSGALTLPILTTLEGLVGENFAEAAA
ncbi:MAG: ABC transporter permease, partial [Rhodococcus sp. (in: high G+C Gram-positive bacteria)]|nr:ABC transporter permease [Rhodococcus sp. (in: high G+C Gram-positive bacteria)]MDX5453483.1 ABC transporter permease [Rhodococcus sp. (in: high G+C Gram-positive bacteria)]